MCSTELLYFKKLNNLVQLIIWKGVGVGGVGLLFCVVVPLVFLHKLHAKFIHMNPDWITEKQHSFTYLCSLTMTLISLLLLSPT